MYILQATGENHIKSYLYIGQEKKVFRIPRKRPVSPGFRWSNSYGISCILSQNKYDII